MGQEDNRKEKAIIRRLLIVILLVIIILVVHSRYYSGKLGRAMLSHRIGWMYYATMRIIPEKNLEGISHYVSSNVHPYGEVRDDGPAWMLIYGEAWCDSVANIFVRMVETIDIRGYLIFLATGDHSVAYVTPGVMDLRWKDIDYLQEHAVVVDVQGDIVYDQPPREICKNSKNNSYRYCENPTPFLTNQPISQYKPFKRWFYQKAFPHIPIWWVKKYVQVALFVSKLEKAERAYYLARVSQLFFDHEGAKKEYQKVIANYPETRWAKLASYWENQLATGG